MSFISSFSLHVESPRDVSWDDPTMLMEGTMFRAPKKKLKKSLRVYGDLGAWIPPPPPEIFWNLGLKWCTLASNLHVSAPFLNCNWLHLGYYFSVNTQLFVVVVVFWGETSCRHSWPPSWVTTPKCTMWKSVHSPTWTLWICIMWVAQLLSVL